MTVSLEELLAASTPGPWEAREREYRVLTNVGEAYPAGRGRYGKWEDAQLAALAPDAVRLLIDMGDELPFLRDTSDDGERAERANALLARLDRLGT